MPVVIGYLVLGVSTSFKRLMQNGRFLQLQDYLVSGVLFDMNRGLPFVRLYSVTDVRNTGVFKKIIPKVEDIFIEVFVEIAI